MAALFLLASALLGLASWAGASPAPASPKSTEAPDWVGKLAGNYRVGGERVFRKVVTVDAEDRAVAPGKTESDLRTAAASFGAVDLEELVESYLKRMVGECASNEAEKKTAEQAAGALPKSLLKTVSPTAEWRHPDDGTAHLLLEFKLETLKQGLGGAQQVPQALRDCFLERADEIFDLGLNPAGKGAAAPAESEPEPVPAEPTAPLDTVKVSTEAKSWRPFSVTKAQELGEVESFFEFKLKRIRLEDPAEGTDGEERKPRYEYKGTRGAAKVFARSYRGRRARTLVVSVFPEDLAKFRTHLELHFKVVKGHLKAVSLKAISVDRGVKKGRWDDSLLLSAKGIPFMEELPRRSKIALEALEARASKRSLNIGRIRRTKFTDPLLGRIRFAYNRQGVTSGNWLIRRLQKKDKPKRSRRKARSR